MTSIEDNRVTIDGRKLYNAFAKGAEKVVEKRKLLDDINVFPVADGDTGKNMAQTLRSIAKNTKPDNSVSTVSKDMAQAALLSSRGNSGIILAQFINGISKATSQRDYLRLTEFAQAMKEGANHAYKATNQPVEGTILTVMREWAQSLQKYASSKKDLPESLEDSLEVANNSLKETKSRLRELREANVVDAGAKGFVLFLEGISAFFKEGKTAAFESIDDLEEETTHHIDANQGMAGPRYCTEIILTGESLETEELRILAEDFGESLVVAGGEGQYHIHIHTDNPAELMYELEKTGTVADQKVDDMRKQHEAVYERTTDVAIVTDSTCDLPREVMDDLPIYSVPLTVSFGDDQFLDKTTITPDQFYRMLEELGKDEEYPTSSQPSPGQFKETYSFLLENYESIVSLHIAGPLSGTVEAARKAAKEVDESRISVIDTRQLSTSLGLIVREAANQLKNGLSQQELVEYTESLRNKAKILVSVKDLKYMVMGGRVNRLEGFLARLLNFKPIISLDETGDSELHGRPLLRKTNFNQILDMVKNPHNNSRVKRYAIGHVRAPEEANEIATMIKKETGLTPDYTMDISPLIGAHAGIGAVSVSYLTE
ncbi:DegV family EDD domain-containing protein [Candidatus Bipolaricaulota bacterium]|nr:DegV family EDD domain-containing protein [Candidatus Bipolaricaulota bacterium]